MTALLGERIEQLHAHDAGRELDGTFPRRVRPRVSGPCAGFAGNPEQVLAELPAKRRAKVERRAAELATRTDLRHAVERTQELLPAASASDPQDRFATDGLEWFRNANPIRA